MSVRSISLLYFLLYNCQLLLQFKRRRSQNVSESSFLSLKYCWYNLGFETLNLFTALQFLIHQKGAGENTISFRESVSDISVCNLQFSLVRFSNKIFDLHCSFWSADDTAQIPSATRQNKKQNISFFQLF